MPQDIATSMRFLGGAAHIQDLLRFGYSRHQIAAMKNAGDLIRPRIGWYVAGDASPDVVRAVRVGGRVTCVSAARAQGLWVPRDSDLHVSVSRNASRLRSSRNHAVHLPAGEEHGIRLHWEDAPSSRPGGIAPVIETLAHCESCLPFEWLVACLDSARRPQFGSRPVLDPATATTLMTRFGPTGRAAWAASSSRAESPYESLARTRLRKAGLEVQEQVTVGRYRADLLIAESVVVECDGRHHAESEQFTIDRDRDAYFARNGLRTLRFTTRQIAEEWDAVVLPAVLTAVADATGAFHGSGTTARHAGGTS